MPTTRKKIIKTVYKDENSEEEEGGDFSDSGSEAIISDIISESSSPEEEFDDEESFNKSKRKYPAKKSARNFTRKINKSGCDMLENHPVFSIKDLTEADKLLPPILNLSESDTSDEESPHTLNRSSFTSFQLTAQDHESDNEVNKEYKNIWSNIEKVQDDSEEIAKKTFMELEQHKSKIEETRATLQNYTLKVVEPESDVRDMLALGEEVYGIPEISTVNKKSKLKRRKDDSDSDMEDWEEVKDTKAISQQGIQLVVEFPDTGRRKHKKIDVEMMMKRKINKVKKEYQVYMHKVHVLSWVGHGNYISNVLNDRVLMAAALSLVPSKECRPKNKVDKKYIDEIITCYKDNVTLKPDKNEEKFKPKAPLLKNLLLDLIKRRVVTSKKYMVFIFVILLRALGLQCRVMFNFVTLPIKPPATELCSLSTKPKDKKTSNSQKQNLTLEETELAETKTTKSNTRKAKSKKKNIAQVDGNYDVTSDDEIGQLKWNGNHFLYSEFENIMQVDGGDDGPTTKRTRSNKRHIADVIENIKDENVSPPKKSRKNPTSISLKQNVTCNENMNTDVSKKVKRGRNAVDTDEKYKSSDHLRSNSSNLKELTNITSAELTKENTPSTKVLRKSSRRTTQQTLSNGNEKKDMIVHKKSQRNLKTLDVKMKLNQPVDDFASNNYEIIEENVSSLKITRKSPRRNNPKPLAESDKNDVVLSKRTQRRDKTDSEVKLNTGDNSKTHNNNRKKSAMLPSEMSAEDVSPPKIARNSQGRYSLKPHTKGDENKVETINKSFQNRKGVANTDGKFDTSNNVNFIATTRSLTRSQKSKHANDNINEQQKNDKNTKRKATNNGKKSIDPKNNTKATLVNAENLQIPHVIITRGNFKHITRKNVENTNPTDIQRRLTRKRSQTTNSASPKGTNSVKDRVNKAKSVTKRAFGVDMKQNICDEGETSQNSSKISVRELSESQQAVSDKKITRNNKPERIEDSKNKKIKSEPQTRKKSLKGNAKQESDVDADYLQIDPKHHHSDSDDSFKPPKFSYMSPKTNNRGNRRVLSSSTGNGSSNKNKMDIWCEVFVEELQEWISIDIVYGKIKSTKEIYANATQPVCYVVGWDHNNNLKDLTRKYVPHFNTETRKLRVDVLWWNKAVHPYLGPKTARDKEEDELLDKMQLEAPLPTVIGEYKNHPLYVLKRHLLKFEALYPPDATVLGFVRGEPVYARECVYTCRSRNIWYKKHAKVVRLGEKAYKLVKAQPRWDKINRKIITDDPPMEIFGPWQVEDFEPPVAENGIVPRNEYGNVELFKQCMLPKGTVHLKLPGLNRIAKKLNIDCATAITGFEVNHGWVRPVYDGFVVCKEFEDIITEAWADDQEEQERKELERTELRVYGNWKRLIKGLFIRERLKNKYGFNESPTSTSNKGKSKGLKQVTKKRK